MLRKKTVLISTVSLLGFAIVLPLASYCQPQIRKEDKIRILETRKIAQQFGDSIWPAFNEPDFAILLLYDTVEFLLYHRNPSKDFKFVGYDSVLATEVLWRPKSLPAFIMAAFPIGGISTIVVGTTTNTRTKSTQWITKVLHERLHQLQQNDPTYMSETKGLGLADNDTTGSWMINYPFPYDDPVVNDRFVDYSRSIALAVNKIGMKDFKSAVKVYTAKKRLFFKSLTALQYKYFAFQIWQEGMGRYTEYKFLEMLNDYRPSPELMQLDDFVSFPELKQTVIKSVDRFLNELDLARGRRDCFYSIGYGEGRILDALKKDWRKKYFAVKFDIEEYF